MQSYSFFVVYKFIFSLAEYCVIVAKRNVQSQSALENLANQRLIQILLQTCGYQNKLLGAVTRTYYIEFSLIRVSSDKSSCNTG